LVDIILARHGNTFNPEDKVVRAGLTEDLELVPAGIEQAKKAADFIKKDSVKVSAVYCGTLKRTAGYSEIIRQRISPELPVRIDPRLDEIDYGLWAGLTDRDIIDRYGAEPLEAWNKHSAWPAEASFKPLEDVIISEVRDLAQEIVKFHDSDSTVVLVSSNGKLRYFLKLVKGAFEQHVEQQEFKVRTGALCKLTHKNNKFSISYWNVRP